MTRIEFERTSAGADFRTVFSSRPNCSKEVKTDSYTPPPSFQPWLDQEAATGIKPLSAATRASVCCRERLQSSSVKVLESLPKIPRLRTPCRRHAHHPATVTCEKSPPEVSNPLRLTDRSYPGLAVSRAEMTTVLRDGWRDAVDQAIRCVCWGCTERL